MPDVTGVVLIDKPFGPTSREVLDGLEHKFRIGPLGHAGTLDPLASGLLVVLAGRARKLQEFFLERQKAYVARIRFGETSPTLDAEGPVTSTGKLPDRLDPAGIRALLDRFQGAVLQAPPLFSAVRVNGRRAHKLARKGDDPVLEPRPVRIDRIELLAAEANDWILEITCGAGVYIRSLARDLGEARGCGAYLADLRRTLSGGLRVEDAVLPITASLSDMKSLADVLRSEPGIDVDHTEAHLLSCGNVIERKTAEEPRFAWFGGRPCFRLITPKPGYVRSDLLIEAPPLGFGG